MRRLDEKSVGLGLLIHGEIKRFCKENKLNIKDAIEQALINYLTEKIKKR
jgi:hypothetical protein|tara:strand:- start:6363 stop:6512 length:150 start_codon:yes stop_codon:yes gene_type:complete